MVNVKMWNNGESVVFSLAFLGSVNTDPNFHVFVPFKYLTIPIILHFFNFIFLIYQSIFNSLKNIYIMGILCINIYHFKVLFIEHDLSDQHVYSWTMFMTINLLINYLDMFF